MRDVTLEIMPGDRKAIIGPNGAGKTTLFNLITGIFPASSGQVLLFGQDVTSWPSHRRTALGMARTFQITSLFPKLTVLDNVLLAIEGVRKTKFVMWRFLSSYRDLYVQAHRLLEQADFLDRKDTQVRYLSHGEQRQLEIVLGLASDPKILLLDEPAAGLSSGESSEMAQFLMRLDPGLAILLIEHDMDVVFDVADHISVLHFGEILESGINGRNPPQREGAGNLSGDRLISWRYWKSTTFTLITETPTFSRGCPCSSSRGRYWGCSDATASARRRWSIRSWDSPRRAGAGSSSRASTSPRSRRSKPCAAGWGSFRKGGASSRP